MRRDDPGRKAILDDLRHQFAYENSPGPLGYPMLDGQGICEEMLVVHEVSPGQPLVLCSDGYPVVCETREESERALRTILEEDPLLMRLHPSTKGWDPSNESYDDRTWVSLGTKGEPDPKIWPPGRDSPCKPSPVVTFAAPYLQQPALPYSGGERTQASVQGASIGRA